MAPEVRNYPAHPITGKAETPKVNEFVVCEPEKNQDCLGAQSMFLVDNGGDMEIVFRQPGADAAGGKNPLSGGYLGQFLKDIKAINKDIPEDPYALTFYLGEHFIPGWDEKYEAQRPVLDAFMTLIEGSSTMSEEERVNVLKQMPEGAGQRLVSAMKEIDQKLARIWSPNGTALNPKEVQQIKNVFQKHGWMIGLAPAPKGVDPKDIEKRQPYRFFTHQLLTQECGVTVTKDRKAHFLDANPTASINFLHGSGFEYAACFDPSRTNALYLLDPGASTVLAPRLKTRLQYMSGLQPDAFTFDQEITKILNAPVEFDPADALMFTESGRLFLHSSLKQDHLVTENKKLQQQSLEMQEDMKWMQYGFIAVIAVLNPMTWSVLKKAYKGAAHRLGFAPLTTVNKVSDNLSKRAREGNYREVVDQTTHDQVAKLEQRIFQEAGDKNVVYTAPAGWGKQKVIEQLALKNKADYSVEFFQTNGDNLMAGTMYRGSLEENVKDVPKEIEMALKKGKLVVLVIDEFHETAQAGRNMEDARTLMERWKGPLAEGKLTILGFTTPKEYRMMRWIAGHIKDSELPPEELAEFESNGIKKNSNLAALIERFMHFNAPVRKEAEMRTILVDEIEHRNKKGLTRIDISSEAIDLIIKQSGADNPKEGYITRRAFQVLNYIEEQKKTEARDQGLIPRREAVGRVAMLARGVTPSFIQSGWKRIKDRTPKQQVTLQISEQDIQTVLKANFRDGAVRAGLTPATAATSAKQPADNEPDKSNGSEGSKEEFKPLAGNEKEIAQVIENVEREASNGKRVKISPEAMRLAIQTVDTKEHGSFQERVDLMRRLMLKAAEGASGPIVTSENFATAYNNWYEARDQRSQRLAYIADHFESSQASEAMRAVWSQNPGQAERTAIQAWLLEGWQALEAAEGACLEPSVAEHQEKLAVRFEQVMQEKGLFASSAGRVPPPRPARAKASTKKVEPSRYDRSESDTIARQVVRGESYSLMLEKVLAHQPDMAQIKAVLEADALGVRFEETGMHGAETFNDMIERAAGEDSARAHELRLQADAWLVEILKADPGLSEQAVADALVARFVPEQLSQHSGVLLERDSAGRFTIEARLRDHAGRQESGVVPRSRGNGAVEARQRAERDVARRRRVRSFH